MKISKSSTRTGSVTSLTRAMPNFSETCPGRSSRRVCPDSILHTTSRQYFGRVQTPSSTLFQRNCWHGKACLLRASFCGYSPGSDSILHTTSRQFYSKSRLHPPHCFSAIAGTARPAERASSYGYSPVTDSILHTIVCPIFSKFRLHPPH